LPSEKICHAILCKKIRGRRTGSRENLIRLLPQIHHLRVYDNSAEGDPFHGRPPRPVPVLEMKEQRITAPNDLTRAPDWAQPIVAAALRLHRR
jgi:hypothetical protein